ncbi:hypothetical protein KSC_107480 [Ktedonobacter sp. SOSP1-52]|uniref:transaldolase family protein n=1 Tax=Ktedonobacter sp. SOSP1-52 TaxID=2778366 RepID=UPI001916C117|nr:transaldolase family protein [Ktedonobacter sp. SOSP1-52]GHO71856.1 hypothetical protein KSC_107480 [Ktedonobacter sp. SOSP1-52]
MTNVRQVANLLRPTYERTDGQDGFVSIEVSPALASETEKTLAEVRRFWQSIDRPNLVVKIPATPAGIPAIRQALVEGININITLMFSIKNYRQVAEAYLFALEERLADSRDISRIASVASFFVSRVDVLVDHLLEEREDDPRSSKANTIPGAPRKDCHRQRTPGLSGVHTTFWRSTFCGAQSARSAGAPSLWANTGTKKPVYRDVLETLIGPDTVNTMPLATLERWRSPGQAHRSIKDDLQAAQESLSALALVGIQKFLDSFQALLDSIEKKRQQIQA